ncbi:hypothetical protein SESBI_31087 [Sesbania bispinosa]|nr:hypothetical protein SESBI_31087 [Sesbania bispinosa]
MRNEMSSARVSSEEEDLLQRSTKKRNVQGESLRDDSKWFEKEFSEISNDQPRPWVPVPTIPISKDELEAWSNPWKDSLIVKLLGRRVNYKVIEAKLQKSWVKNGFISIIDIHNDYYAVHFSSMEDYNHALFEGPWMIADHYLTVQRWRPLFSLDDQTFKRLPGFAFRNFLLNYTMLASFGGWATHLTCPEMTASMTAVTEDGGLTECPSSISVPVGEKRADVDNQPASGTAETYTQKEITSKETLNVEKIKEKQPMQRNQSSSGKSLFGEGSSFAALNDSAIINEQNSILMISFTAGPSNTKPIVFLARVRDPAARKNKQVKQVSKASSSIGPKEKAQPKRKRLKPNFKVVEQKSQSTVHAKQPTPKPVAKSISSPAKSIIKHTSESTCPKEIDADHEWVFHQNMIINQAQHDRYSIQRRMTNALDNNVMHINGDTLAFVQAKQKAKDTIEFVLKPPDDLKPVDDSGDQEIDSLVNVNL